LNSAVKSVDEPVGSDSRKRFSFTHIPSDTYTNRTRQPHAYGKARDASIRSVELPGAQ
jgi:hypothetical protein